MAKQYPDSIAIKDGLGAKLTYSDLLRRVQCIGHQLLSVGVKLGDRVAVFQKPSADWICSILAILRVGAVYVPLDLRNPLPRLAAVTRTAQPAAILVEKSTLHLVPQLEPNTARLIDVNVTDIDVPPRSWTSPASGDDVAVNMFTSGSTGAPKGVMINHRNLARHLEGYVQAGNFGREVVLQQSAFSFDMSLCQIFVALTLGGALIVVGEDKRVDSAEIASLIRSEGVTWTIATPSEYTSWFQFGGEDLKRAVSWKFAICGGEEMKREILQSLDTLDHKSVRLFNAYGPAETTIIVAMTEIPFRQISRQDMLSLPMGYPIPNYSVYIVDEDLKLLPCGFVGEICIGGPATTMGYINNEELTRERFLPDPFASTDERSRGWVTMYRTGDMGRLATDGQLFFEGRQGGSTQVKLRGVRMDVVDIEETLVGASQGVLSDAVVSVRTEVGVLVAHVQFAKDRTPEDPTAYLKDLIATLPLATYMRPAMAIPIEKIPLNMHGKKDRRAILQLELPRLASSSEQGGPPTLTPTQESLVRAWRSVLPAGFAENFQIGADTNFFAVGGNSLLLVKLKARIREMFDVTLPLRELLDAISVEEMAAKIEACGTKANRIDWVVETRLDHTEMGITEAQIDDVSPPRSGKLTVLMTGVTGYFGPFILQQLLEEPSISKIHCVAVRAQNEESARNRIPLSWNKKVVVHVGDITAPRLGLSEETFRRLAQETDVILHAAANRSFWDSYYELRVVNVSSTRELAKMAAARKIPIHFFSSNGVLHYSKHQPYEQPARSVATFPPPVDGSDGYVASKWASEVYLENVAHEIGIPVTIHRFIPGAPHELTPETKTPILHDLVHCCLKLQTVPDWANWDGHVDFIESRTLARSITASLAGSGMAARVESSPEEAVFIHHFGEARVTLLEMRTFIDDAIGDKFQKTLPLLNWIGEIKRVGFKYLLGSHDFSKSEGTRLRYRR